MAEMKMKMEMKMKPILIALVSVVLMLLVVSTGCSKPLSQVWVEVSCDEFYDNHHINTMLEVQIGETFEVKLCSNPTTGFQWSEIVPISNATILKQEDHKFIGAENEPPPPPGTSGQEIWTFKALKQGSSDIYLEYGRPWEGGEKGEWTCTVNVVVVNSVGRVSN
ncbi:protease inhibitor I42 family protein [Chloroflexota bacterium]